ncbi:MAG: hypothetical protein K6A65_05010, partial [Succinivibrionaceae bacterium]|nr:hypothetical protein [Succinivibrionaceae bacterium]
MGQAAGAARRRFLTRVPLYPELKAIAADLGDPLAAEVLSMLLYFTARRGGKPFSRLEHAHQAALHLMEPPQR